MSEKAFFKQNKCGHWQHVSDVVARIVAGWRK